MYFMDSIPLVAATGAAEPSFSEDDDSGCPKSTSALENSPAGMLDGQPFQAAFAFTAVAALAAAGDLKLILHGGISGARRIKRHLSRMCVALFIAAASFFLGQPKVFPASVRGSFILFVPEIAILGLLVFWMIRVRRTLQPWQEVADLRMVISPTKAADLVRIQSRR
jgi:hypothetical protein